MRSDFDFSPLYRATVGFDMWERDEAGGLEDMPYPPDYPKMPGEPKRVQPSRAKKD